MNGGKASRIQIPKVVSYSAPIILGLVILFGFSTSLLPTQLRVAALVLPIPIGIAVGVALYYRLAHEVVLYDDNGFEIIHGAKESASYKWNNFAEVSLISDSKGGVNLRLYFKPDGDHVDIPGTRIGLDPISLRNTLQSKIGRT